MALTDEEKRNKWILLATQAIEILKITWTTGKDPRSMAVKKELYDFVTKGVINGTNG